MSPDNWVNCTVWPGVTKKSLNTANYLTGSVEC